MQRGLSSTHPQVKCIYKNCINHVSYKDVVHSDHSFDKLHFATSLGSRPKNFFSQVIISDTSGPSLQLFSALGTACGVLADPWIWSQVTEMIFNRHRFQFPFTCPASPLWATGSNLILSYRTGRALGAAFVDSIDFYVLRRDRSSELLGWWTWSPRAVWFTAHLGSAHMTHVQIGALQYSAGRLMWGINRFATNLTSQCG